MRSLSLMIFSLSATMRNICSNWTTERWRHWLTFAAKQQRSALKTRHRSGTLSLKSTMSKVKSRPTWRSAKLCRQCPSCFSRRTVNCTWCMSRCSTTSDKSVLTSAQLFKKEWLWFKTSSQGKRTSALCRWMKTRRFATRSNRQLPLTMLRSRTIKIRWRFTRDRCRVWSRNSNLKSRAKFKSNWWSPKTRKKTMTLL